MYKKLKLPILYKYIIIEIIKPFLFILLLLFLIMLIFSTYEFLQKIATGILTKSVLLPLIFFKNILSLEVLIPLSFFLACTLVLSKMDDSNEMTAILSSGSNSAKVFKPVIMLTIIVAIFATFQGFVIRPWAYKNIYYLEFYSKRAFDISKINPGHFVSFENGSKIVYADEKTKDNILQNVFLQTKSDNTLELIYAKSGYINNESGLFILRDGTMYLYNTQTKKESFAKFETTYIDISNNEAVEYKTKAMSISELLQKKTNVSIVELEWRITIPFMTFFLGLLSTALSRSSPRIKRRSQKLILAILIYGLYYNLYDVVEEWVKRSLFPALPGTFSLTALLLVVYIYIKIKNKKEYLY